VNCYLPYFRQWLICCQLLAIYFYRLCLLKVCMEDSSLLLLLSLVHSKYPAPSAACPFQFLVYYLVFFFLCGAGVILSRWLCLFIPGVAVGVLHATYLLTCWSVSPKQIWSWHLAVEEPSWFLCVMWHGGTVRAGGSVCQSLAYSW
jgi:hypothetical protein